jgi:hypothetical protein
VIRSTWDYSWRPAEFLAWGDRCGSLTSLANRPSVLRWNADKRYLGMLADLGVPVVPTRYLSPGSPADLPHSHEYVIKPTSGAGARFAARYRPEDHDEALRHLERMQAEGLTAMVQPYMRRIDTTGERALIFVAGRFLHAVRKNAVLSPGLPTTSGRCPIRGCGRGRPRGPSWRRPNGRLPPCPAVGICCTPGWTSSRMRTGTPRSWKSSWWSRTSS